MADQDKRPSAPKADTPEPKKKTAKKKTAKKKGAKKKGAKRSAARKKKNLAGARQEIRSVRPDSGVDVPAQNPPPVDAEARARERIAAAASAAAAQLGKKGPTGLTALLDEAGGQAAAPAASPDQGDAPGDRPGTEAPLAQPGTDETAGPTAAPGPDPRFAPEAGPESGPESGPPSAVTPNTGIPPAPVQSASDPDASEHGDVVPIAEPAETVPTPASTSEHDPATGWGATLVLLLLLAIAGAFYVRAILPIRSADDGPVPESRTEMMANGASVESSGRGIATEDSQTRPASGGREPDRVEAPYRPVSVPPVEPAADTPKLKPLPADQIEIILRALAPELLRAESPTRD